MRRLLFGLLVVFVFVFIGTSRVELSQNVGEILSIADAQVSIKTSMYDELILRTDDANIEVEGKSVDLSALAVGDIIEFESTGIVTRSLPPQSTATYIKLLK